MAAKKVITLGDVKELYARIDEVMLSLLKRRSSKTKRIAESAEKQYKTIELYLRILDRGIRAQLQVTQEVTSGDLFLVYPSEIVLTGPRISASYQGLNMAVSRAVR